METAIFCLIFMFSFFIGFCLCLFFLNLYKKHEKNYLEKEFLDLKRIIEKNSKSIDLSDNKNNLSKEIRDEWFYGAGGE